MEEKTFKELYKERKQQPTPAKKFIAEVAELTHRSELTVRMWLYDVAKPDDLAKSIIAEKYGVKAETLFPESVTEKGGAK